MFVDLLLILFLGPIGIVIVIFRHLGGNKKSVDPKTDKDWFLQISLSKEDAISQTFLLLSFFFFGITLFAFNRDLGDPYSWRGILLVISLVGLIGAYYLRTFYTLAFSLIGLATWWGAQAAGWMAPKDIKMSALFVGFSFLALLFYSLGRLHEKQIKFKRYSFVYLIFGIIAVTCILFFLSTKPGIVAIEDMTQGRSFLGSWQITLSLVVFFLSLIGVTLYAGEQKLLLPWESLAVLALMFLFGMTALLPEQKMFLQAVRPSDFYNGNNALSQSGVLWALIYNFAVFFELLGLVFAGYVRRETWLINLGALFLFLLIIVKYFDWFFTSLDKSLFFIGAGILLFVVGWFMERGRRYMISNIKAQEQKLS